MGCGKYLRQREKKCSKLKNEREHERIRNIHSTPTGQQVSHVGTSCLCLMEGGREAVDGRHSSCFAIVGHLYFKKPWASIKSILTGFR